MEIWLLFGVPRTGRIWVLFGPVSGTAKLGSIVWVCGTVLEMGSGEVDADVVEDLIRCSSSDAKTSSRDL